MKFTVQRNDILHEAELALGAVETKTTIPVLANFRLKADAIGVVELAATDLELALVTAFPAEVKTSGTATLPAKRLVEILKSLPDGEVRVQALENHWVQVTSGKSKFKLPGIAAENFPTIPTAPQKTATLPATELGEAIKRTVFAISHEESRYTLNGALLLVKSDGITLVATDGHRLALAQGKPEVGNGKSGKDEVRVLVPKAALEALRSLIGRRGDAATVGFAQDDAHLYFRSDARILVARKMAGQFPNYEAVLPKENHRIATVDAAAFARSVARVGLLADGRSHAVKLTASQGKLEVASASGEFGEAHDDIEAAFEGEAITIGFNYHYLLDFLGLVTGPVRLLLKDESSAAELRPEGDAYRYVLMPMRV